MSRFAQRRERVLAAAGRDDRQSSVGRMAFLTRDLPTIRYLTGFSGSNAALVVTDEQTTLITDGRYRDQAQAETHEVSVVIERDAMGVAASLVSGSVCVDPSFAIGDVTRLERAGVSVHVAHSDLRNVRCVKDEDELQALVRACSITARALLAMADRISVGLTEVHVARSLEELFATYGADDRAFATIVASGPHSAIPHHKPGERALCAGDLLVIDCGASVDGYHADMTRTFVVGNDAQPWQQEIHDVVRAAQSAAINAALPGAAARDVDEAARSVIRDAGFGESFTHGTGHGVGLQIHEPPMVMASSVDTISAGVSMTVEPGIYLPGRGGVRIEDTIVVGETARVLTDAPRDLIVVG